MAMMDVSSYKRELLIDIFNNKEIVDAIDCKADGYYPEEPDTIIYRGLFPYLRIPEPQTAASTYVLISVDMSDINKYNSTYCDVLITLWVMSHQSLMQMNGKGSATRIDYIAEELKKLFDGQRKYGFNKLKLTSSKEVILNEDYQYRELIFITNDLRQTVRSCPKTT